MPWLRLTLETTAEHVEALTDLLEKFDASAISYTPVSDEELFAGVAEDPVLWQKTAISALVATGVEMDILLACLRNRIGTKNIFSHKLELLKDEDWTQAHKHDFDARVFSGKLCICPSWIEPSTEYPYTVVLDPGLAFGTGTHPTTSLCLDWLARNDLSAKVVIDYGCGSGILALAAARLGANKVYAIDIDPQAIMATLANAESNDLANKIVASLSENITLPRTDILLANILLNPLLQLSVQLSSLVGLGGEIVLSGILSTQVDECLATYGQWFKMGEPEYCDEWALLHGYRQVEASNNF